MNTLVSGRYVVPVAAENGERADFIGFFVALARHFDETRARVQAHYRRLATQRHLRRGMPAVIAE